MDIGVGTGLFPVKHREQMRQKNQEWPQHLALVDMNPSCLQKAAERIDCPSKTECIFGNTNDSPEVFFKALENEFEEVETHIVGVVLLFRASKPRIPIATEIMNAGISNLEWRLDSGPYVHGCPEYEGWIRRSGFATAILPRASRLSRLSIDMEENPCKIQSGLGMDELSTPLILFHDAGDTVFPYFCLGELLRPFYGINISHFDQGGKWDLDYSHLLRSAIGSGAVILGGWSLGGCVALELASRLMRLSQYTVIHRMIAEVAASFQLPARMSDARRVQAQQCTLYAHKMQRLPLKIFIRAADSVHFNPGAKPRYLDLIRNWAYLGWEEYDTSFIQACMGIPGNHFTIFDDQHCHRITTKFREACAMLTMLTQSQQPNLE
ncbi:hypothetical protein BO83DRAFT_399912 [Aspergillus eucalypticola CBS 122712]|uniref:Alpha/beta-hydrolase n=1 Tax=Aspergillus eucalypticola (strain CBS 122712 / IBT 29274) TaxID=1448314 RepID=A0A317VC24_ASPEC|nr:uncharacterized protein BO83DRAFT_399912 [Aspergillus eucalypticola CBS 122712]PWY70791.1 hypothetical protein BO83DRAFT_399912 [Aspergillus eucalypticola CBS 122712]